MIAASGASVIVLLFLLLAEKLREQKKIAGETARKFVHITVGVFVASWPFYLSQFTMVCLSLAFLVVILVSRRYHIFYAIHNVYRKTWGDVLFPIGIGLTAVLAYNPWIFSAAILHLALADGMAAIVGERYGKAHAYKILGQKKTIEGTAVFYVISLLIVMILVFLAPTGLGHVALPLLLWLPLIATMVENIAPRGADNILVPLTVCVILNSLVLFG